MLRVDDEYFQFCVLKNTSSSMMYNIFYNEYSAFMIPVPEI